MITENQTKKEIKKLIRSTKDVIEETKVNLETAERLLATLELEVSRLGNLTTRNTSKPRAPKILTYETAKLHQKVRILN